MIHTQKQFKEVEILTPVAQATVDAWTDVVGGKIDTLFKTSLVIALRNTHATKDLDWKILGSIDYATYYEVVASATVQELTAGTPYTTTQAVYRYYKIQVKSTVGANPSEATLSIIAK